MPECNKCENYDKKNERCNLPVAVNTFDDECTEFSSREMTSKKAIEIITTDSAAGDIVDATKYLLQTEKERDEMRERLKIMQHRCVCLTEGHLCKYCVYVDCEYKDQEETQNDD